MNSDRKRVNLILAAMVLGLGAWTIYYLGSDQGQTPAIQPPQPAGCRLTILNSRRIAADRLCQGPDGA